MVKTVPFVFSKELSDLRLVESTFLDITLFILRTFTVSKYGSSGEVFTRSQVTDIWSVNHLERGQTVAKTSVGGQYRTLCLGFEGKWIEHIDWM